MGVSVCGGVVIRDLTEVLVDKVLFILAAVDKKIWRQINKSTSRAVVEYRSFPVIFQYKTKGNKVKGQQLKKAGYV